MKTNTKNSNLNYLKSIFILSFCMCITGTKEASSSPRNFFSKPSLLSLLSRFTSSSTISKNTSFVKNVSGESVTLKVAKNDGANVSKDKLTLPSSSKLYFQNKSESSTQKIDFNESNKDITLKSGDRLLINTQSKNGLNKKTSISLLGNYLKVTSDKNDPTRGRTLKSHYLDLTNDTGEVRVSKTTFGSNRTIKTKDTSFDTKSESANYTIDKEFSPLLTKFRNENGNSISSYYTLNTGSKISSYIDKNTGDSKRVYTLSNGDEFQITKTGSKSTITNILPDGTVTTKIKSPGFYGEKITHTNGTASRYSYKLNSNGTTTETISANNNSILINRDKDGNKLSVLNIK